MPIEDVEATATKLAADIAAERGGTHDNGRAANGTGKPPKKYKVKRKVSKLSTIIIQFLVINMKINQKYCRF